MIGGFIECMYATPFAMSRAMVNFTNQFNEFSFCKRFFKLPPDRYSVTIAILGGEMHTPERKKN
jgi:hypothetical protein